MNLEKLTKDNVLLHTVCLFIGLLAVMTAMYFWGYTQCTVDVSKRLKSFDTKGEECYTREEVDNFIYGEQCFQNTLSQF